MPPNLSAGRQDPRRTKCAAGVLPCPRTIWGQSPWPPREYTGRRLQVFDLGAFRVARQNMRIALRELLAQLDLQELCHDGVVGHSHEGRARTADPDGLGAAVKAGVAHGVVVGNQTATIGFLDAIVIGGGNPGLGHQSPSRASYRRCGPSATRRWRAESPAARPCAPRSCAPRRAESR